MARIKPTNDYFLEKAKKVHNSKFDYSLVEYKGAHNKVQIKCPKGHTFEQRPMDHWRGIGCKFCSQQRLGAYSKYSLDEVKDLLHKKYGNKYLFDFTGYTTLESKIKCICSKHGTKSIRVSSLLKGYHCSECKGTKVANVTLEYFIRKSREIHGNYYNYSDSIVNNAQDKVTVICPKHGEFRQSPNSHMHGQGCPVCKFSKGELKIRKWLIENKINFISQHKFPVLKRLSFDFYLPDRDICIEYDGEYHYHSYKRVGGDEGLRKRQARDSKKNLFCQEKNIILIRIPYWEFNNIETILKQILQ